MTHKTGLCSLARRPRNPSTPIINAIVHGMLAEKSDITPILSLIDKSKRINRDLHGDTPLHYPVGFDLRVVQWLLEHGTDLSLAQQSHWPYSIAYSVASGRFESGREDEVSMGQVINPYSLNAPRHIRQ